MTCIGQWAMSRSGVGYFLAETLRTIAVSCSVLFSMPSDSMSLLATTQNEEDMWSTATARP